MRYFIALLLLVSSYCSNAQSDKLKKKAYQWAFGVLDAVSYKGSTETAELCKFYHDGEYKGKVYPAFVDQEPQDYFATVASRNGCMRCMCWLGVMKMHLYNGESVEANFTHALPYIQKAADGGDVKAMMVLASEIYMQYPWRNLSTSKMWYERAAAKGDTAALRQVANINLAQSNPYEKGMEAYDKKNYEEALRIWKLDYNLNFNGKAAYNVGLLYANGRGVAKNYDSAHLYYRHACSEDFKTACAELGEVSYAKQDYLSAADELTEAKKKGCVVNQAHLDDAVARKKATTDYWAEKQANEKATRAAIDARRKEDDDRKATVNVIINPSNAGTNTQKLPAKSCPFCKGTGAVSSASSKSLEQGKDGRWYTVYTPGKVSACGYCKGTGLR